MLPFDKENPVEKYVASNVLLGSIAYDKLCNEVSQRVGVHRAMVDVVLKGVQDSMISFLEEGFSVKLGEFGSFRPSIEAKSQDREEDVNADTVSRAKIVFTPGVKFQQMLSGVSIMSFSDKVNEEKVDAGEPEDGSDGESPDPIV